MPDEAFLGDNFVGEDGSSKDIPAELHEKEGLIEKQEENEEIKESQKIPEVNFMDE